MANSVQWEMRFFQIYNSFSIYLILFHKTVHLTENKIHIYWKKSLFLNYFRNTWCGTQMQHAFWSKPLLEGTFAKFHYIQFLNLHEECTIRPDQTEIYFLLRVCAVVIYAKDEYCVSLLNLIGPFEKMGCIM